MATTNSPTSPRSVMPGSPGRSDESRTRDVNAIVEDAAKRFDEMDQQLKTLIEEVKNEHAAIAQLNECRYKTAKHLESLVAGSPIYGVVGPSVVGASVLTGVANKTLDEAPKGEEAVDEEKPETTEAKEETEGCLKPVAEESTTETEEPKDRDEKTEPTVAEDKLDSFADVHQSVYDHTKKYLNQYDAYLLKYVVDWEQAVSARVNGLLIHYRELHQTAIHYHKKIGGLQGKVDKSKSVRRALAEKLDRNEIKTMGADEARDTVGEHLFLLIDETTERIWRDVLPQLVRACRFEADFSAQQASLLSHLNKIADDLKVIGDEYGADVLGRLDDISKKHPEELYTTENPFVKLTPLKMPPAHLEEAAAHEGEEDVEKVEENVEGEVKEAAEHVEL